MNAFLLLLVTLAMLLGVVNAGILCDNETWTNCNDRYKKCQVRTEVVVSCTVFTITLRFSSVF